jgi:hypothetical protein
MTSIGVPLTKKCRWIPFSWMESGPSVLAVFAGTGISERRSVLALDVVVACDTVVVTVLRLLVLAPDVALGFGELLQAAATKPMVIATAAETYV